MLARVSFSFSICDLPMADASYLLHHCVLPTAHTQTLTTVLIAFVFVALARRDQSMLFDQGSYAVPCLSCALLYFGAESSTDVSYERACSRFWSQFLVRPRSRDGAATDPELRAAAASSFHGFFLKVVFGHSYDAPW